MKTSLSSVRKSVLCLRTCQIFSLPPLLLPYSNIDDRHCALTFEDDFDDVCLYRSVLKDLKSMNGTAVEYDDEGGELRRDFRWILGGHDVANKVEKSSFKSSHTSSSSSSSFAMTQLRRRTLTKSTNSSRGLRIRKLSSVTSVSQAVETPSLLAERIRQAKAQSLSDTGHSAKEPSPL